MPEEITCPGPEVSVPTPIAYENVRVIVPTRKKVFPDGTSAQEVHNWIQAIEAWGWGELLRRENAVRASYGMQPRTDKASAVSMVVPPIADAPRPTVATSGPIVVTGHGGVTQQGAQVIADVAAKAIDAPPAKPVLPTTGKPWPPGKDIAANRRVCQDPSHPLAKPKFIDVLQHDTSVRFYAMPLCTDHVKTHQKVN